MKRLMLFITGFVLLGVTAYGSTFGNYAHNMNFRSYGNSFIFVEQGVEFAVFPDGQFDFNVLRNNRAFAAYADFGNVSVSFNSGFDYNAFVQYDDYGAVIQVEHVPIYYDYYGRIVQAGNVRIFYNNFGFVRRIGGLYVHYNRFNQFSYCTGFINVFNRHYVYRPWHRYYLLPSVDYRIVYHRPYRRYYRPIRHDYYRPYRDNYRPRVNYNRSRRSTADLRRSQRQSDRYIQRNTRQRNRSLTDARPADRTMQSRRERANVETRQSARRIEGPAKRQNTPRRAVEAPKRNMNKNTRIAERPRQAKKVERSVKTQRQMPKKRVAASGKMQQRPKAAKKVERRSPSKVRQNNRATTTSPNRKARRRQ